MTKWDWVRARLVRSIISYDIISRFQDYGVVPRYQVKLNLLISVVS